MSKEALNMMKAVPVGPWGGLGGSQFDDGIFTAVRQVVVVHALAIDSIQIEYDNKGSSVWSTKHGGTGGTKTDKITLDFPNEFLTSISGHYGSIYSGYPVVVRSLTFESNRAKYGPFGCQQGTHFSFTNTVGMIVGFHGQCGWHLDSIGVHLQPLQRLNSSNNLNPIQRQFSYSRESSEVETKNNRNDVNAMKIVPAGPWGGIGGSQFDDGVYTAIRQLIVVHGTVIDSIQIEYDSKGSSIWSVKHGGSGGTKTDKIKLDYPNEVLTSISGHFGSFFPGGPIVIRSLTFESNRAIYGPFGSTQGTVFSLSNSSGQIVGFHGRCGWYLDSIGVYLKPIQKQNPASALVPSPSQRQASKTDELGVGETKTMKHETNVVQAIPVGPWGGYGGILFDDGVYTTTRQLVLVHGSAIDSIQIEYDDKGTSLWSSKHGGSGGSKTDKIKLEFPDEVLTSISGHLGSFFSGGPTVVRSLTFESNKRKYGPFGCEQGTNFSLSNAGGLIVGFHGRCGWYLDSIGVYLKPLPQPTPSTALIAPQPLRQPSKTHELSDGESKHKFQDVNVAVEEPVLSGPVPWGGDGGRLWDDGKFSGVKQIFLSRGQAISSIQIEYDGYGKPVWSSKHGAGAGDFTHKIRLGYPNEILTGISGRYGSIDRDGRSTVIRSLTFHTNKGTYGPYGEEMGTFFTSTNAKGKVIGFYGRSGLYLDAIGVHMQQILGEKETNNKKLQKYRFLSFLSKKPKSQQVKKV